MASEIFTFSAMEDSTELDLIRRLKQYSKSNGINFNWIVCQALERQEKVLLRQKDYKEFLSLTGLMPKGVK